jgi:MtfA peptidase
MLPSSTPPESDGPDDLEQEVAWPPFPEDWLAFLETNVAHYQLLSDSERARLQGDALTLIAQKSWEGCGGVVVTDEMSVTIAAEACLMLLGVEHDCFRRVQTILIYPSAFKVTDEQWQDAGWAPMPAQGQAIYGGPVILAWDAVLAEARDPSRGHNIVIHEFAHHLDFMDGSADGTLDLEGEQAERWHEVTTAEYDTLCRKVRKGRDTFIGDYAATSRTEFFAVASERFFTRPAALRHYHPALYEVLAETYALDPAQWFAEKS